MLQKSGVYVWKYLNPKMIGVGYSTLFCCFITSLCYTMNVVYGLLIFITGFLKPLPWYSDHVRDWMGDVLSSTQNITTATSQLTTASWENQFPGCQA